MRRLTTIAGAVALVLACSDPGSPRRNNVLGVEDVVAPTELASNTELVATITVITGGCKKFDRFTTSRSEGRLTVEAWGTDAAAGQVCTRDLRFEPHEYRATLPAGNPVILAVRRPNGADLVRQIQIR